MLERRYPVSSHQAQVPDTEGFLETVLSRRGLIASMPVIDLVGSPVNVILQSAYGLYHHIAADNTSPSSKPGSGQHHDVYT